VGCCDDGICSMSWSPDQELVLFVTANYKLVLMTRDFDTLSEQAAHQTGFGEGFCFWKKDLSLYYALYRCS